MQQLIYHSRINVVCMEVCGHAQIVKSAHHWLTAIMTMPNGVQAFTVMNGRISIEYDGCVYIPSPRTRSLFTSFVMCFYRLLPLLACCSSR